MACLAPTVTLDEAIRTSLAFTAIYVAVLYLPFNAGPRHATHTIISRVITLTILAILLEAYIRNRLRLVSYNHSSSTRLAAVAAGLGLTLMLYIGHILVTPIRNLSMHSLAHDRFQALRNYVLAPLLEEVVFRRQSLLIWSCQPLRWQILFPALMFALAHAHHIRTLSPVALAFQLVYTFLFGVYAAALYINTLSVAAPFAAHVVCNVLELPDFVAISEHRRRHLIYIVYVIALVAFAVGFSPVTSIVRPSLFMSQ